MWDKSSQKSSSIFTAVSIQYRHVTDRQTDRQTDTCMYADSSRYGCELWSLDSSHINDFGTAWRKAARRVLKLLPDTHNSLIPLLLNSLLFAQDVCKRSACFIISCLKSEMSSVQSVARFDVLANRCMSLLARIALYTVVPTSDGVLTCL